MDFLLISGDIFHIIAIAILLFNILTSKSTTGLSYRAQEIYLVVFLARYSDMIIVEHPLTLYLLTTRALLIALTILTIYYMRLSVPHSKTFDREIDLFPRHWIYLFSAGIAAIVPEHYSFYGYLWTFSIWLQVFSILPQAYMIFNEAQINKSLTKYIQLLTLYRIFYVFHWILDWEKMKIHSMMAAIIQILIYAWFLYKLSVKKKTIEFMTLPS